MSERIRGLNGWEEDYVENSDRNMTLIFGLFLKGGLTDHKLVIGQL